MSIWCYLKTYKGEPTQLVEVAEAMEDFLAEVTVAVSSNDKQRIIKLRRDGKGGFLCKMHNP